MKKVFAFILALALVTLACSLSPVAKPTESSNILFSDDFSDPDSGWDTRNDGDIMEYSGGGYRMYISGTMADLIASAGQSFQADVVIDVDATKIGGTDDNDFGVLCRMKDMDNFYFFQVSSDGYAVIGKYLNNEMSYLSADSMQAVEGLLAGSATNHIRAECIGESLKLYANEKLIASVTDSTFTSGGDAGLMAGTFNEGGVDILFDNFSVVKP